MPPHISVTLVTKRYSSLNIGDPKRKPDKNSDYSSTLPLIVFVVFIFAIRITYIRHLL